MSPAKLRDATNERPAHRRRARFEPPGWLSVEAKRIFTDLVVQLDDAAPGAIVALDVPVVALAAQHCATAQSASTAMRTERGNRVDALEVDTAHGGQLRKRAAWQVMREATGAYVMLARELGLTPRARRALELDAAPPVLDDDEDDLESALG